MVIVSWGCGGVRVKNGNSNLESGTTNRGRSLAYKAGRCVQESLLESSGLFSAPFLGFQIIIECPLLAESRR